MLTLLAWSIIVYATYVFVNKLEEFNLLPENEFWYKLSVLLIMVTCIVPGFLLARFMFG